MQFNRELFFLSLAFLICSSTAFREIDEEDGDEYKGTLPLFLSNRPRVISIFSKPAEPDAPKETGPNILGHIGNVIHGGSIGVEIRPISGIQGFISHAKKKLIPGGHPQVGTPENQKPPPETYEPSEGDKWEDEKDWLPENPSKPEEIPEKPSKPEWVPENPSKPVPEGPSWEDIGEDPEDDPNIPYEDIINPRLKPQRRSKRSYRNSKIYHLPLAFLSNGKPFRVKFSNSGSKNRGLGKSMNGFLRK